jgi:hypothetical protein
VDHHPADKLVQNTATDDAQQYGWNTWLQPQDLEYSNGDRRYKQNGCQCHPGAAAGRGDLVGGHAAYC